MKCTPYPNSDCLAGVEARSDAWQLMAILKSSQNYYLKRKPPIGHNIGIPDPLWRLAPHGGCWVRSLAGRPSIVVEWEYIYNFGGPAEALPKAFSKFHFSKWQEFGAALNP